MSEPSGGVWIDPGRLSFTVTCPACREQYPLPATTVTQLLGGEPGYMWLSVEVGPVYRLPHTCLGLPS